MSPAAEHSTVLMYHRVGEVRNAAEARYAITPDKFSAQVRALARAGHRAVPLEALVEWLHGGEPLCQGDFVLTFDDGYAGIREHALPVLQQLKWPFAVFLVTDKLSLMDHWRRADGVAPGQHSLLSPDDVLRMHSQGCSFHSHTCTHASLTTLDAASLKDELTNSRAALSCLLGDASFCIAYPYGHVDDRVEAAARAAGYRAGFSVQPGFNRADVNPFRIRRLDVAGTDSPAALLRKMRLGSNDGGIQQAIAYYWRRAAARLSPPLP